MDNKPNSAPVIPSGTEPTVFGTASYPAGVGQAGNLPSAVKSESEVPKELQPSQTEAPKGTTYDELAAKKGFKSQDDLALAYANLERQFTQDRQEGLAELLKSRGEDQQPVVPPQEVTPQEVVTESDALRVVEQVVRKFTRPLENQLALQQLMYKNPDVEQFAGQMASIVKSNPGISWEVAYKAAKFDALGATSREEGKKEAYQTIQQKQAVTTSPAKPVARDTRPIDELIKDKSIPFSEVQKIMKERFSQ